jgi:hypothetical protein
VLLRVVSYNCVKAFVQSEHADHGHVARSDQSGYNIYSSTTQGSSSPCQNIFINDLSGTVTSPSSFYS